MSDPEKALTTRELRRIALTTLLVIGITALAILLYRLIDIFFILFVGIVIAAALQPWHVKLCNWGAPKALAVLLIYVVFLIGLVSIVLLIGPILLDQVNSFLTDFPGNYSILRTNLQGSTAVPLRFLGDRLPPFERLTDSVTRASPDFYQRIIGATMSVAEMLVYIVTLLAVAFYWTMEVGRFERLIVSLMPVERRVRVLNIWHEIESKLGGFVRGQGLAMLAIGVASGIGYALIGLPNALALGVLAGLLEAVPLLGPVLAAVPAVLVALPIGLNTALLVVGLAAVLQMTENYVLIPRIMDKTVGVSALVNILAVLAFGALYGFAGILIAIPMAAAIQVLLASWVIEAPRVENSQALVGDPWTSLRGHLELLRQRVRDRLRSRESRMGIDPSEADHVIDAVDQRIEQAVARIKEAISEAEEASGRMTDEARAAVIKRLETATEGIERTIDLVDPIIAAVKNGAGPEGESSGPQLAELAQATGQISQDVERLEAAIATIVATPSESREG
jgi:predicted PurR-regulated permease PerM